MAPPIAKERSRVLQRTHMAPDIRNLSRSFASTQKVTPFVQYALEVRFQLLGALIPKGKKKEVPVGEDVCTGANLSGTGSRTLPAALILLVCRS